MSELELRNEQLALEIKQFMEHYDLLMDTCIYFNNAAFDYDDDSHSYVLIRDIQPSEYFEYANDNTVSMSFEGRFNHIFNYGTDNFILDKFNAIFGRHDCYYIPGHAWNLTVYYD